MRLIPGEWRYFDETLNMPYPWYAKPVLEYLESIDLKGKKVFEYGVGDSTLWYRAKGCNVMGVDHDYKWASKFQMPCRSCGESDYVNSISGRDWDIVVVDGIYRKQCAYHGLLYLADGGIMIIDNFEQPSVEMDFGDIRNKIQMHNMKLQVFKEPNHYDWQTAIITK